jgi:hypothetical protein
MTTVPIPNDRRTRSIAGVRSGSSQIHFLATGEARNDDGTDTE